MPTRAPLFPALGRAAVSVALALALPAAARAAHYPAGSHCYDCHSVSRTKMVSGTHLIKKSDKTVALGITGSSTPIRCLFCHEKNAVSAAGRTEMRGVWDHFDASSASRHPAAAESTFTPDPGALDCLDCHPGVSTGVASDGAGNANVHGVDAATQAVDLYRTLIGGPADRAAVSASTCQNAACHDADGGSVGGYAAPPRHATANVTIHGGAVPTACTQCHGDHNSYQNTSLLVLRTDGTTSNHLSDPPATRVSPAQCGECHSQDDGAQPAYSTKGHGRAAISGGSIRCTACHSDTVPHGFSRSAPAGNPERFALPLSDAATASTLTGKNTYSLCLTCHASYAGKAHSARNVGCNDCHEPHGVGTGANAKMVRTAPPADYTSDATGLPVGTSSVSGALTFTGPADDYRAAAGAGFCDNVDCHGGVVRGGLAIQPLSGFLDSGKHSGPVIQDAEAPYDCGGCHRHTDAAGSWRASNACLACHGQPPAASGSTAAGYATFAETATPHRLHAAAQADGGYQFPCRACHGDTLANGTHDSLPTKTYQTLRFDQYLDAQSQPLNPSGVYSGGAGVWTCSGLYCHSDGSSRAAIGAGVKWMLGAPSTPNPLTCRGCHGGIDAGATRIATGLHPIHLAWGGASPITCANCHGATVTSATTDAATVVTGRAAHANGAKDVNPGGSFNGKTVAFAYGSGTCRNITCHGGYRDVAWNAATGQCSNCHGAFVDGGGMAAAVVAKHGGALANPDGDPTTTVAASHAYGTVDPTHHAEQCDYCHASHENGANYAAAMHLDGAVQLNATVSYQGVSGGGRAGPAAGCANACHPADAPYQMADSGLPLQGIAGPALTCASCHGSLATGQWWPDGTAYPDRGGDHQKHVDAVYARNAGTLAGSTVTDKKNHTCSWCHPMADPDNPAADHNRNTAGSDVNRADVAMDGFNQATHFRRINGLANGVATDAYATAAQVCSNVDCHNRAPTPPGGWTTPPDWSAGLDAKCSNTSCHAPATYDVAPGGSHLIHVGTPDLSDPAHPKFRKAYACTECHPGRGADLAHTDGLVQLSFTGATSLEQSKGAGNGYYDVDGGGTLTPADSTPSAYATGTPQRCFNMYCHGGDNPGWSPQNPAPNWGTAATLQWCTECHASMRTYAPWGTGLATGSHQAHLSTPGGARLERAGNSYAHPFRPTGGCRCHNIPDDTNPVNTSCESCHQNNGAGNASNPTYTHVDGNVDFAGNGTAGTTLAATAACDGCHSLAVVTEGKPGSQQAKERWWTGQDLECATCHNAAGPAQFVMVVPGWPTGSYLAAAKDTSFATTGHGKASAYAATGNPGANLACTACHDRSSVHVNYSRLFFSPESAPPPGRYRAVADDGLAYTDRTSNLCGDCHRPGAGAGTLGVNATSKASVHSGGATGRYDTAAEAPNAFPAYGDAANYAANPGYQCDACHDPHGTARLAMVLPTLDGRLGGASNPKNLAAGAFVTADADLRDLDPSAAADDGVCDLCHRASGATAPHPDTARAGDHKQGGTGTSCVGCHDHAKSFQGSCAACHGYPPPESPFRDTTVTWNSDKAATPAGVGGHGRHAAGATPYAPGDCNATCHVASTHATNKTTANMGAKAATAAASTGVYKYSTVDNYSTWSGGASAGNVSVVNDSCTNVTCHDATYSSNTHRSAANPSYTRYWVNQLDCYTCHGYDGTTPSTNGRPSLDRVLSRSHWAHVGSYSLACSNCHDTTGYTTAHKNGAVNFTANFGAARIAGATGGAYDADGVSPFVTAAGVVPTGDGGGVGYTCANVACHSGGVPRGGARAYANNARWGGPASGACGTCHGVDRTLGAMTTNAHAIHTATGGYNFGCAVCHAAVAMDSPGIPPSIVSTTLHVNGANNASFAANEGTYAQTTGGTVGPAGGTCSAVYCHTTGLDRSAPYTGTGSAPRVAADWDTAPGVLGCNGCHGDASVSYPNYPNNTAIQPGSVVLTKKNSHAKHAAYSCDRCHYTATHDGTTIVWGGLHEDRLWSLWPNAAAGVTFTVATQGTLTDAAYTPTTCSNISCHGGSSATWGGPSLTCDQCHLVAAGETNDFVFGNDVTATLNAAEWAGSGHGRPAARGALIPSNRPSPAFAGPAGDVKGCAYCHAFLGNATNPLVAHGAGTNPFRLVNKGVLGRGATEDGGWNDVCLVCHASLDADGYDPDGAAAGYPAKNGHDVDATHYGSLHAAATRGGAFCWDCHDPHGDPENSYMTHAAVADRTDGVYGVPASTKTVASFQVGNSLDWDSGDLVKSDNTGFCQVCHAANGTPGGARYYNRTLFTPLATHNAADGTLCTVCHAHGKKFEAAPCTSCHGSTAAGTWWPDGAAEHGGAYPNRPGKHPQHVEAIYQKTRAVQPSFTRSGTCRSCHDQPGRGGHELNTAGTPANTADVLGDGVAVSYPFFPAIEGSYNSSYAASYDNAAGPNGKRCSSAPCHWMQPTPVTGVATADGDGWYSPGAVSTCANCHGDGATGATLPDAHPAHVAPLYPWGGALGVWGRAFACTQCHPDQGADTAHQNNRTDLTFQATLGEPGAVAASATGAHAVPVGGVGGGTAVTCANFYCHGADLNNGGTKPVPAWGVVTTGDCGTCHGLYGNPAGKVFAGADRPAAYAVTSGSHQAHFTAERGPKLLDNHQMAGCFQCHPSFFPANHQVGCSNCHTGPSTSDYAGASNIGATHVDGKVDFGNTDQTTVAVSRLGTTAPAPGPTAASTDRCNRCHSAASVAGQVGTVLAKANWGNGAYRLPCSSCHNGVGQALSQPEGASRPAPNVLGNLVNWGAEVLGHGRPTASGAYPASGNAAANRACADCHDPESAHVNHADDTTYAGNRLRSTINTVAGLTTVSGACGACHQSGAGTPAQAQVATHGNTNAAFKAASTHDGAAGTGLAEDFAYQCEACHEPHGLTANGRTATSANVFMVKPSVQLRNTSVSTVAADLTTLVPVVFEARTGPESFDDGLTQANNVCVACHQHVNRPGGATALDNAAGDATHAGLSDYGANASGTDCSGCHSHDLDQSAATVDGLMPLSCNACHSYPGLATVGGTHRLTATHDEHVGRPSDEAGIPNRGYACAVCHSGASHNDAGVATPAEWSSKVNADTHVQVRFDAMNPAAQAANPAQRTLDSAVYGEASNTCGSLFCHGAAFPTPTGTDPTPEWGSAATGACGACHATTGIASGSHLGHLTAARGPTFGAGGCTGTATTGCHPAHDLVTGGNHGNGRVDFANVMAASASALGTNVPAAPGDLTVGTDRCNRCHSRLPADATGGAVLAKSNWATPGYRLPCLTCHGNADPATRYADGSSAAAPAKDAYFATAGHGRPAASGAYPATGSPAANYVEARCTACHDDAAAHLSGALGDSNRLKVVTESPALAYTGAVSEVCLDCHKPGKAANGSLGKDATREASVHSGGVTGRFNTVALAPTAFPAYGDAGGYAANPGYQCEACHDPHGTPRLAMVRDTLDGRLGGTSNPKNLAAGVFVAADADLRDLDPSAAADDGVCDLCHRGAGATAPHPDTLHAGSHNQGDEGASCTACHSHGKSFQATCDSCHGSTATGQYWPDGSGGKPAYADDQGGAHDRHVLAIGRHLGFGDYGPAMYGDAQQKAICAVCHPSPGGAGHTANGGGDGRVDVYGGTGAGDLFQRLAGAGALADDAHGTATYAAATGTCANVDCHYETPTPLYGGAGWNEAAAQAADCLTCHYYRDNATYAAPMAAGALPDAHGAHVGGVPPPNNRQSKGYACSVCHDVTGYAVTHADGQVQVGTVGLPNRTGSEGIALSGAAVKYGAGAAATTCTALWCHGGQFAAGTRGTNVVPQWNLHTSAYCGTCHDVDVKSSGTFGQQLTQGAHQKHMGGQGGPAAAAHAADCTYCHGIKSVVGGTAGCQSQLCHPGGTDMPGDVSDANWASFPSTSHVEPNGAAQYAVDFQDQARSWNWFDEYTSAKPSPAAVGLAATDICNRCHSTAVVAGGKAGGQHAKDGWAAPAPLPCVTCHNTADPADSTPVAAGVNAPVVDPAGPAYGSHLKATTGDSLTAGTDWTVQCTKCHSGHAGTAGSVTVATPPLNWTNAAGESHVTGNMQTVLGLAYRTGINLGGPGTVASISAKTTEAEVCWGCHDANGVSEWGYNTDTNGGGFPVVQLPTATDGAAGSFNFGWLYTDAAYGTKTSDWTAGYWKDQYDPLLRRRVASVHTAYLGSTAAGRSSSVAANVDAGGLVKWGAAALEPKSYIRCSYCHDVHELGKAQGDARTGKPYLRGSWLGNPYPPDVPPRSAYTYTKTVAAGAVPTPRPVSTARDKGGYFIDQNSGNPTSGRTLDDTAGLCVLCHGSNVDGMNYYTGSSLWRTGNGHSNSTLGGTGAAKADLFDATRASGYVMAFQQSTGAGSRYVCEFGCDPAAPMANLLNNSAADVATSGWYGTDFTNWYAAGRVGGATAPGAKAHQFPCSKCHTPHASGLPALLTQNCLDPGIGDFTRNSGAVTPYRSTANNCHRKTAVGDGWHRLAPAQ